MKYVRVVQELPAQPEQHRYAVLSNRKKNLLVVTYDT